MSSPTSPLLIPLALVRLSMFMLQSYHFHGRLLLTECTNFIVHLAQFGLPGRLDPDGSAGSGSWLYGCTVVFLPVALCGIFL